MRERLTPEGYEQAKQKLRYLETRLAGMKKRTDLSPKLLTSVCRSSIPMMRKLLRNIKLYEAQQAKQQRETLT
jgi:hypothetical protein